MGTKTNLSRRYYWNLYANVDRNIQGATLIENIFFDMTKAFDVTSYAIQSYEVVAVVVF